MNRLADSGIPWIGEIPEGWGVEPFRRLFRESKEVNGSSPVGPMLSISGYRGVEEKIYESATLVRDDDQLENYRVVRPGQLDRVAGVAQVGEVDALDDPAGVDVEAGDDAYGEGHRPSSPAVTERDACAARATSTSGVRGWSPSSANGTQSA